MARRVITLVSTIVLGAWLVGCRAVPNLPQADWSKPGWSIRQGQALWTARRGEESIAGELLLASREGETIVQFAKPPFTLISARSTPEGWTLDKPLQHRIYGGPSTPPADISWFALPRAIAGPSSVPPPWVFTQPEGGFWRLENVKTGERLEGYLGP